MRMKIIGRILLSGFICMASLTYIEGGYAMETNAITGKKCVLIVAPENFRDEEAFRPKAIIEEAGGIVTVASLERGECTGVLGGTIEATMYLAAVDVNAFDAIIFVGGGGSSCYFDSALAHAICQSAIEQDKVLAAICIAPTILARAGVLQGKKATIWGGDADHALRKNGAQYTGSAVEVDGNIITANGPASADAFGKAIVLRLGQCT